jgi:hypothetical protein
MTDESSITIRKPSRYQNEEDKRQSAEEHKEFLAGKRKVWGMDIHELKIFCDAWNAHGPEVQNLFYNSQMKG